MRKKRKGSEKEFCDHLAEEEFRPVVDAKSFSSRYHCSLEDYNVIRKRCREDGSGNESVTSCKRGIATAPCGAALSLVLPGRGLKRKIGCIDVATQTGRTKIIGDDYTSGKNIGRGKFGSVWLCTSKSNGVDFACKTLLKGQETVHREVEIMQHLSGHPGVVTLQSVYEEVDCFHLVMELCTGGRLIDQMMKDGQYSEQRAATIFRDVMLVIKYCHDMGVVHRDIKPENILLTTSGKIKLADFGLATRISNGQTLSGLAGSPAYVAPEILTGNYSEKVDIWSAGVLLHALLIGILPFQGDSLDSVFEAIKNRKLEFNTGKWESVSKAAGDLVARMLTRDVSARISADEVLRHPWLVLYTDRSLETLPFKSKSRNHAAHGSMPYSTTSMSRRNRAPDGSFCGINTHNNGYSFSLKSEEQDECGLIDALAVAISHVKISEPKRSRLCVLDGPIEQCSSNMTANLCSAF